MMMRSMEAMGLVLLDGQPELPAMNPELSILHQVVRNGIAKGVGHLPVEAVHSATPVIAMNGAELLNFSSCSYLGLEHHDALTEGTCLLYTSDAADD